MSQAIEGIVGAVRNRSSHFFVISGNVYDIINYNGQAFPDIMEFIYMLTSKKFPNAITYDLFSGINVVRGDKKEIINGMGLKEQDSSQDENAALVKMLKQVKSGTASPFPVNPLEAFPCFDQLLAKPNIKPTALIIDYADTLVPSVLQNGNSQQQKVLGIALTKWSRNATIRASNHLIILICRKITNLDELIIDRAFETLQFRIAKPDESERYEFLRQAGVQEAHLSSLGKTTAGLSFRDLNGIAKCSKEEKDVHKLLNKVFSLKQKILQEENGDLMEIMQPRNGFDSIGGLEKPIAKLKRIAEAMCAGKTALAPMGILFMGPPGTGKTVLAEAFAKEAGLNFVKPRDIKSMWVGESERRMTTFLDAVKDLAPVVVFIDEFDQNQSQRGDFNGDSGVSKSLFKKMLEAMSDTSLRGKVLWVMATNRPDLIDPAMKRPGRCDLRIPFLEPDEHQLTLICKAAFKQYPDMVSDIDDWTPYAKQSDGYTGADMIEVIRRAWEHANEDGRASITNVDMQWAIKDYKPQVLEKTMMTKMTVLAILECSSRSLLPDNWEIIIKKHQLKNDLGDPLENTGIGSSGYTFCSKN